MSWRILYIQEALKDLKRLDPFNRKLILKSIEKTAERPLPRPDGIGKPLGNHPGSKLSGYLKIKLRDLGYRVVYKLETRNSEMIVLVISIRDNDDVDQEAERRAKRMKIQSEGNE